MKQVDYMRKVKKRKIKWNEKLRQRGLPSWEQSQAVIRNVNN